MFIVWLTGLMCSSSLHSCTLMSKLMLVSFTLFRNLLSSSNRWRRNCRLCKSKCVLVRIVLTMLNKQNILLRDVRCFLFFLILHYLSCFTFYTYTELPKQKPNTEHSITCRNRSSVLHGIVMPFHVSCCYKRR